MKGWRLSWFEAASGMPARAAHLATEIEANDADGAKQAALQNLNEGERKKYRCKAKAIKQDASAPKPGPEPVDA